jgi:hypothetical protein
MCSFSLHGRNTTKRTQRRSLFAIPFATGNLVSLIERKNRSCSVFWPMMSSLLPFLKVRKKISAVTFTGTFSMIKMAAASLKGCMDKGWGPEALPRLCHDEGKVGGCMINMIRRPVESLVGCCFAKKLSGWGKSWRLYDWHVADEAAGWEISWLLFRREIFRMRSKMADTSQINVQVDNKMAAASPRHCYDEE